MLYAGCSTAAIATLRSQPQTFSSACTITSRSSSRSSNREKDQLSIKLPLQFLTRAASVERRNTSYRHWAISVDFKNTELGDKKREELVEGQQPNDLKMLSSVEVALGEIGLFWHFLPLLDWSHSLKIEVSTDEQAQCSCDYCSPHMVTRSVVLIWWRTTARQVKCS